MKKRKHLQTNFFKFIVEKYNKEIRDELNDEETNLSDDELIDDIDDIEEPSEPKKKIKEDDDLNLDELIEEYKLHRSTLQKILLRYNVKLHKNKSFIKCDKEFFSYFNKSTASTSKPSSTNLVVNIEPMYPAAPVIKIFLIVKLFLF
jgi:hypothetical protein